MFKCVSFGSYVTFRTEVDTMSILRFLDTGVLRSTFLLAVSNLVTLVSRTCLVPNVHSSFNGIWSALCDYVSLGETMPPHVFNGIMSLDNKDNFHRV